MPLSVDWPSKVVTVPQADLTDLGGGVFSLDLDQFRLELKAIEASDEGMPFVDIHRHSPPIVVAGTALARVVEIINGYTVTFEDGQYAVNLVGANSNVADVSNVNQVSIRPQNSAGLIQIATGSGLSQQEQDKLDELHRIHGLKTGEPLEITDGARASGALSQIISDDGTTTTVTRQ